MLQDNDIHAVGEWQTMMGLGALDASPHKFEDGFYITFVLNADQASCHKLTTYNSSQLPTEKQITLRIVQAETQREVVIGTIWITLSYVGLFGLATLLALCGVPIAARDYLVVGYRAELNDFFQWGMNSVKKQSKGETLVTRLGKHF